MKGLKMGKKLISLVLALMLLLSVLSVSAFATSIDEAKASLADLEITQTYNGKATNDAVHDYRTDGNSVAVTYEVTLKMTDVMAEYLAARQEHLYHATFEVRFEIDDAASTLEFTKSGDQVVTFTSTFLKPSETVEYSYAGRSGKTFSYKITFKESDIQGNTLKFPMELVAYYDESAVYGYEDAVAKYPDEQFFFVKEDYTAADWEEEIKISLAELKVKASVGPTVTTAQSTWRTITATGAVSGEFSYVTAAVPSSIGSVPHFAENDGWHKTLKFGNDADITEWTSNETKLLLKRTSSTTPVPPPPTPTPTPPSPPADLNTDDHFAYIIGYPDGLVKPEGNITRAEVATIFFRMLTDEARDKYWSKTNNYVDVDSTKWFNNAVSTLSNMGIINGYPDGTFRPNASITRAEFAKIAVSFFKDHVRETMGDKFSDISGKWYTEYINLAAELAIVNGYPDGTFRPDNSINRAEAMTIVNNTLRRSPHKDHLLPEDDMITWPDNPKSAWYYAAVQEATNSHEYQRASTDDTEQWTKELPVRDWAALERAWSEANSSRNPGEVVGG